MAQESARDLVRARENVRGNLMRARHRVTKLLLRHGELYCGGAAWTGKHLAWLREQRFDYPSTRAAFDADLEAVEFATARRDRLDAAIAAMAADSEFTDITRRLACLRGISTLTGFALAVETGDWHRFTGASIGAYLGLVPSEHSTGSSRRLAAAPAMDQLLHPAQGTHRRHDRHRPRALCLVLVARGLGVAAATGLDPGTAGEQREEPSAEHL